jgi:hypothetical protein
MKMHKSITQKVIVDAVQSNMQTLSNLGYCIACGYEHDECEPDARCYECEDCGEFQVYGAEELLMEIAV